MNELPPISVETGRHLVPNNSLMRTLNIFHDAWSYLIFAALITGHHRFDALQKYLKIPRQTLSRRLEALTDHQIVFRKPVIGRKLLLEYHLTAKGWDLYSYGLTMWQWQVRWNRDYTNLNPDLIHAPCGHALTIRPVCGHCLEPYTHKDVQMDPGPGEGYEEGPRVRLGRGGWDSRRKVDNADVSNIMIRTTCDRWSILIMAAVLNGKTSYETIRLDRNMATNTLTSRLNDLMAAGLLEGKSKTKNGNNLQYLATECGRDFYPSLIELAAWGDRWLAGWNGPPRVKYHTACGNILDNRLVCDNCEKVLRAADIRPAA